MISTIIACSEKNELSNQEVIALLKNLEDLLDSRCKLNEEGKTVFRIAIETLKNSEFPNSSDLINGQAAIDAAISADMENNSGILSEKRARIIDKHISAIPPTQPEITQESAIDYLHSIGWMQNHDKQMYEMCMADADVRPIVRCKDCKHYKTTGNFKTYCDEENFPDEGQKELPEWWFCAGGKRKEKTNEKEKTD